METQNINVQACRFYARMGCTLAGHLGTAPMPRQLSVRNFLRSRGGEIVLLPYGGRDHWPMQSEPAFRAGLYRGTAPYYDRYRPAYPDALFDDLFQRLPLSGYGGLLDLACGTGQVAIPLAGRFARVVAVDQEAEAVAFGRAKTGGHHNIEWIIGAAETIELDASFELVSVGTAFHRLNRPVVAARMFSWLEPGGGVALLWSDAPSQGEAEWQSALTELISTWMARVGTAERIPEGWSEAMQRLSHQAVLTGAGFDYAGKFAFTREEGWTQETLAGYLYSTSILNRGALGAHAVALERDLARLVETYGTGGGVVAEAAYAYELARKPS